MAPGNHIARFLDDCRAVAASEFALILPVLVLVLFGTVEIGNAVLLDKKVTAAAQTAAGCRLQESTRAGPACDASPTQ